MRSITDAQSKKVRQLLTERRSGHTLPQPFYLDADLLEIDLTGIFHRQWLQVALESELPRP